jgi:putative oxidoreductase
MQNPIARMTRPLALDSRGWYALPLRLIVGALIPLASIPMAIVLLVAIFTVHLPNGFSSIKLLAVTATGAHFGPPGYETDLLYLCALTALVLGGAGPYSVERACARNRVSR